MTTKKTEANQTTKNAEPTSGRPDLPAGTRVLNTDDGEPGCIVNGFTRNAAGEWTEYEVETAYGIERWRRDRFVLMSGIETDEQAR